jgi:hypothetical protein
MEPDKETQSLVQIKRLSSNNDYYNIVFKKTERIASAVFYILSYTAPTPITSVHYNNLSIKAMALHEAVIASLNLFEHQVQDGLFPLQHALVVLDSALTVAQSARLITPALRIPVSDEIDQVIRYVRNHYIEGTQLAAAAGSRSTAAVRTARPRRNRILIPKNDMSSEAVFVYSELTDRTQRIKTVLEAKPEATIKDLSDIITDVSTKTIQRDLNSLIESGEVIRQGERRWSKYSIAP